MNYSGIAHLEDYFELLKLYLQRHARTYADRLIDTKEDSYTDDCVGRGELKKVLGLVLGLDGGGDRWLDELGYPKLPEIREALGMHAVQMSRRLQESLGSAETPALPLEELRASFNLDNLELRILVAAAAPSLSMSLARVFRFTWGDFTKQRATAGFLAELVAENPKEVGEALRCLDSRGTLARYRLIVLQENKEEFGQLTPLLHSPVGVPQRVLDFIKGEDLDRASLGGCVLHEVGEDFEALVLEGEVREGLMSAMRAASSRVCLSGPEGSGRRTVLKALASEGGQRLLEVNLCMALMPSESVEGRRPQVLLRLAEILREARLHNALVLLRLEGLSGHPLEEVLKHRAAEMRGLIENYPGRLAVSISGKEPLVPMLFGDISEVVLEVPLAEGQEVLWQRMLRGYMKEERITREIAPLIRCYRLTPGAIHAAIESTLNHALGANRRRRGKAANKAAQRVLNSAALLDSVRRQMNHRLGSLAEAHSVELRLEDVVMREQTRSQIEEVLRYARNSNKVFKEWGLGRKSSGGQGLSVLFSGPPGTGKSLVSAALARELGRVLYRIDLSQVVDKFIGETEKNLGRVFDEAERAQAVLLFDEADALFSKRTKVSSSNDKYSNLEINYLLQKLEQFHGVAILTTNLLTSIDEAFMRRISFRIMFEMPDEKERAILWQKLIPAEAPQATDIDFKRLGEEFELSGGHIRNAVVRAAMEAADLNKPIDSSNLWRAGVSESREIGALINDPLPFYERGPQGR